MRPKYSKDIVAYQAKSIHSLFLINELLHNSLRTIKNVYIFKNFKEYCKQLKSDKKEDKLKIYWETSYGEKLIDYIKISVAFETFNKAQLLKKGIIVHKVNPKFNKKISKLQNSGIPIKMSDFFKNKLESVNLFDRNNEFYGAFYENCSTINYAHTLNENYQKYLNLDSQLLFELKKINQQRNRLHFFTDFTSAFLVSRHIEKWKYIKETSLDLIENEYNISNLELKNYA